jgi:glycerol-3-phosphate acyltransferase PlsX
VLLDAGANADAQAEWLLQWAQMGAVFARDRFGLDVPKVGLLSIGEEPGKGDALRKETFGLLDDPAWAELATATFAGNVEGRDLMAPGIDVVVTDGFTGNVALKTLEGAMRALVGAILGSFDTDDATRAAGEVLMPALLPLYGQLDPDATGGAMLLGVDGVCIISHGSSSGTAIVNAARVAKEMLEADVVERLRAAVAPV